MQYTLALNQRWRDGRSSYRRPTEPIRTAEYDVAEILDDTTAKNFIKVHHYSKTYPAARVRVGLYHRGELAGLSVFSHPCCDAALTNIFPVPAMSAIELGRFLLLDSVAGNGESWFLARSFDILRNKGIRGVISFSDPMPRRTIDGKIIHVGHVGTIYQSHNGIYVGRGFARTLRLLPDGRVFSERAAQKIRKGERGWRYAADQLESFGAPPAPTDDAYARTVWLQSSLAMLTRKLAHKGNHKYAWPLDRSIRSSLPASLPYPKTMDIPHES